MGVGHAERGVKLMQGCEGVSQRETAEHAVFPREKRRNTRCFPERNGGTRGVVLLVGK